MKSNGVKKAKLKPENSDERFQTLNDPRFLKVPLKDKKVKIDKRFTNFVKNNHIHKKNKLDPYGRPYNNQKNASEFQNELKDLYYTSDDESAVQEGIKNVELAEDSTTSSIDPDDTNLSSDDDADFLLDPEREVPHTLWESNDQAIPKGEATKRLAIIGCDWHQITALDLLVLLQSFNTSTLKSDESTLGMSTKVKGIDEVAIYPSDYGLQCMEEEKLNGPNLTFSDSDEEEPPTEFKPFEVPSDDSDDENMENIKTDLKLGVMREDQIASTNLAYKSTEQEEIENQEKLRVYQVKRTLYYYAVVTCSSLDVANKLYDDLDGLDTNIAINGLDLRFIPDDIQIPHPATSIAHDIPSNYEAPQILGTSALRHSKVKCTWDEPDVKRIRILTKRFDPTELEQMDIDDYIGSEDDFSEDDLAGQKNGFFTVDESNLAEYRKTLLGDLIDDDDEPIKKPKPSDKLKIEFKSDLKSLKLGKKQAEANVDPFLTSQSSSINPKKPTKKNNRDNEESTEDTKETANLELLAMDLKRNRHFDLREETENHSKSKKSKKQKKKEKLESQANDDFKLDTEDKRFSKLFSNPEFSLDPTHPQFKSTTATKTLLEMKRKQTASFKKTNKSASTSNSSLNLKSLTKTAPPATNNTHSDQEQADDIVIFEKRKTRKNYS